MYNRNRLNKMQSILARVQDYNKKNIEIDLEKFEYKIFDKNGNVKNHFVCPANWIAGQALRNFDDIYICIMDTRGTGKTVALEVSQCIFNTAKNPACKDGVKRARYLIARSTYAELKSTMIKTFQDNLAMIELGCRGITMNPYPETKLKFFDGKNHYEIEIMFLSFDAKESVGKAQSLDLTGAHLGEATQLPKELVDIISGSVGRYPRKTDRTGDEKDWNFRVVMDANYFSDSNWLYRLFVKNNYERHRFYKGIGGLTVVDDVAEQNIIKILKSQTKSDLVLHNDTYYLLQNKIVFKERKDADNIENLGRMYYLTMAMGKDDKFIYCMICNNFGTTDEGARVHPEFELSRHSVQYLKINMSQDVWIFFDYGGFNGCLVVQYYNRTLFVIKEFLDDKIGLALFSKDVVKKWLMENAMDCKIGFVKGDKANNFNTNDATYSHDTVKSATGWDVLPCITNNLSRRRNAVTKVLLSQLASGEYRVKISKEGCQILTDGLSSGYRLKQARSMIGNDVIIEDKPDKNSIYSHLADCFQYACLEVDFIDSQNSIALDTRLSDFNSFQYKEVLL